MGHTRFTVDINVPAGISSHDMAEYIAEAIQGWRGGYEKEHPLVGVDLKMHVAARQHLHKNFEEESKEAIVRTWGEVALEHLPKPRT
jgi:DnaJ-class molecular chaperone